MYIVRHNETRNETNSYSVSCFNHLRESPEMYFDMRQGQKQWTHIGYKHSGNAVDQRRMEFLERVHNLLPVLEKVSVHYSMEWRTPYTLISTDTRCDEAMSALFISRTIIQYMSTIEQSMKGLFNLTDFVAQQESVPDDKLIAYMFLVSAFHMYQGMGARTFSLNLAGGCSDGNAFYQRGTSLFSSIKWFNGKYRWNLKSLHEQRGYIRDSSFPQRNDEGFNDRSQDVRRCYQFRSEVENFRKGRIHSLTALKARLKETHNLYLCGHMSQGEKVDNFHPQSIYSDLLIDKTHTSYTREDILEIIDRIIEIQTL